MSNPPWMPGCRTSVLEQGIYDEVSSSISFFLLSRSFSWKWLFLGLKSWKPHAERGVPSQHHEICCHAPDREGHLPLDLQQSRAGIVSYIDYVYFLRHSFTFRVELLMRSVVPSPVGRSDRGAVHRVWTSRSKACSWPDLLSSPRLG